MDPVRSPEDASKSPKLPRMISTSAVRGLPALSPCQTSNMVCSSAFIYCGRSCQKHVVWIGRIMSWRGSAAARPLRVRARRLRQEARAELQVSGSPQPESPLEGVRLPLAWQVFPSRAVRGGCRSLRPRCLYS